MALVAGPPAQRATEREAPLIGGRTNLLVWSLLMDTPCHYHKDSLLTSIDKNTNYMGVLSLIFIIAAFAKMRDIISNHLTYGLMPLPPIGLSEVLLLPLSALCLMVTVGLMIGIEKLVFEGLMPNRVAILLEVVNALQAAIIMVLYYRLYRPYYALCLAHGVFVLFGALRVMSYAHFMYELRESLPSILGVHNINDLTKVNISRENLAIVHRYAQKPSKLVSLTNILYYMFAPVIIYQLWYPRTDRVNKKKASYLLAKLIFFTSLNVY